MLQMKSFTSVDTIRRHYRQRIHELKNAIEDYGELVIVERPGTTNLYFVAAHGQPLGAQGEYQTTKRGQHTPGCPSRHPTLRQQCVQRQAPPDPEVVNDESGEVSESPDPSVHNFRDAGEGVLDSPDLWVLETSAGGCQTPLTQKTRDNKREKQRYLRCPVSLAPDKPERQNRWWCDAHGFCHGERLPDHRPDCARER
jgi:hypothetical protein